VCNSGSGLGYHPVSVAAYPKTKHRTALHLARIPWWRIEDDAFVYGILRPFTRELMDRTNEDPATALYGLILPQLLPGGDWEAALVHSDEAGLHGDWETPQRAGTCYMRGLLVSVRYVLRRRYGWPVARVKALMAAVRVAYLSEAAAELRTLADTIDAGIAAAAGLSANSGAVASAAHIAAVTAAQVYEEGSTGDDTYRLGEATTAFTENDAMLVTLGARQTSRALAKLVCRGHVEGGSDEPVSRGRAVVAAIAATLRRVSLVLFGPSFEDVAGGVRRALPLSIEGSAATSSDAMTRDGSHGTDDRMLPFLPLVGADAVVPGAALKVCPPLYKAPAPPCQ
jgi:hypothetical protein